MTSSARTTESLRAAAQAGDPQAQFELGRRYYHGDGLSQDQERATHWLQRAALRGHLVARIYLAELLGETEAKPAQGNDGLERWLGHAQMEMKRGEMRQRALRLVHRNARDFRRRRLTRTLASILVGGSLLVVSFSIWSGVF